LSLGTRLKTSLTLSARLTRLTYLTLTLRALHALNSGLALLTLALLAVALLSIGSRKSRGGQKRCKENIPHLESGDGIKKMKDYCVNMNFG